ncbi:MAG: hypothetical protein R8N23_16670 [Reichenbachiella sp.]|uniref:hypothetical protein n=1 Tax=Reichenbachiella sp. TaxID=2184521 RepID=UPI00296707FF|nr:hypothetical protein [Reichenbachiella sp.]MDW3211507.1 hypothetical protein [Reichenbachiella sp.]
MIDTLTGLAQTQNDNVVNEEVGILHEKKIVKMPVEGSYYLTESASPMTIIQKDSLVHQDIYGIYNIRDDRFEIGSIAIAGEMVWKFEQGENIYIRASTLKPSLEEGDVFFKVLHEGLYDLYVAKEVVFKPSNYNLIMDTGSRSDTYIKEDVYYMFQDQKLVVKSKSIKKIGKFIAESRPSNKLKKPKTEATVKEWLAQMDE